jgi:hypothetical protein
VRRIYRVGANCVKSLYDLALIFNLPLAFLELSLLAGRSCLLTSGI